MPRKFSGYYGARFLFLELRMYLPGWPRSLLHRRRRVWFLASLVSWLHRLSFEAVPANQPDEVTRPREIELTPEFKKAKVACFRNSVLVVDPTFSTQFDVPFAKDGCHWATHRRGNSPLRNPARDRCEVGRSMADRSHRLPEWPRRFAPPEREERVAWIVGEIVGIIEATKHLRLHWRDPQ